MTTGWTVRGLNPGEARFSARPDRPWGPPSLLYNWYPVFPGSKVRPVRDADHSLPSSAAVMEEYSYTSIHHLGHNRACNGNSLPFYLTTLMTAGILGGYLQLCRGSVAINCTSACLSNTKRRRLRKEPWLPLLILSFSTMWRIVFSLQPATVFSPGAGKLSLAPSVVALQCSGM
jgi:hypothetical protein